MTGDLGRTAPRTGGPDAPFTERDRLQMSELGIREGEALRQLALFEDPPPPARLVRPARLSDGILRLEPERGGELVDRFDRARADGRVMKLVPASGAASRMFRDLGALLAEGSEEIPGKTRELFERLDELAFYPHLAAVAEGRGQDLEEMRRRDHRGIAELLLGAGGLGYADLPKGQILFHRYPGGGARTPFEEHLLEAAAYTRDRHGGCRLHFTVTAAHEAGFRRLLERTAPGLGDRLGARFEVGFSHQSHATDTLAVDPGNRPFRLEDGSLLFRPGGHGALIENLAGLGEAGAEVVMIKNIDNVVPEEHLATLAHWKKLLGGTLLELRERVFELLERLAAPAAAGDEALLEEAAGFLAATLCRPLPPKLAAADPERRCRALADRLDRPLRVCGMVVNQGEPGGGPFWVESDGELSLQIVEGSQIDKEDPGQREILAASTHFNPVDLACSLRDRRGRPYDLHRFIDPRTVFISTKSHLGRPLKALERPGLWNGAMAGWNTAFVEVPIDTFAPVKTVMDLLRPEHRPTRAGGTPPRSPL